MSKLTWQAHGPSPNPFEALAGDPTTYTVHMASSGATEDGDLLGALREVVDKVLSLAEVNVRPGVTSLTFAWDVVYSNLEAQYSDPGKHRTAHHAVKCLFPALDEQMQGLFGDPDAEGHDGAVWERETAALHGRVRQLLISALRSADLSVLPGEVQIYFAEEDPETAESEVAVAPLFPR